MTPLDKKKYNQQYRQKNLERLREYDRQRNKLEHRKQKCRDYNRTHKKEKKEYNKKYRQEHQEELKEYEKNRVRPNNFKEQFRKYRKSWENKNRDHRNEYTREWSKNHKESRNKTNRNWRKNHPDKIRLSDHKHHNKRRNKGFIPLWDNPFPKEIEINDHHIYPNLPFTIPMPKDTHLYRNAGPSIKNLNQHIEFNKKWIQKIYNINIDILLFPEANKNLNFY